MKIEVYVVHAFSDNTNGGNAAGVVFLSGNQELSETQMQDLAAKLNFSETAFVAECPVKQDGDTFRGTNRKIDRAFSIRYFTPVCEVPLCGHATIAVFSFLRQQNVINDGIYSFLTIEEELVAEVSDGIVWMEMGHPVLEEKPNEQTIRAICDAYGLARSDLSEEITPRIITAGIRDLHVCVKDHDVLMKARQQKEQVTEISRRLDVAGVHMSCLSKEKGITAFCSNFAPYYGIDEECATGTSNAGLTFYLYQKGLIVPERENCFLQGEHMGRPSKIYSRIRLANGETSVWIGGRGVICEERQINRKSVI